MNVRDFRPLHKSTLRGFFVLELDSGLVVKDCSAHVRDDGRKWFAFPARPMIDADGRVLKDERGKTRYQNLIVIEDRARSDRLQELVLALLEPHLAEAHA